MNDLTEAEVAWLAGIYEGEGSCAISKTGRAINVTVTMTDFDIIERLHALTGLGSVSGPFARGDNKPYKTWQVSSIDAVTFLETIKPWLGMRREARAVEAIDNWRNNRTQSVPSDTHCIHGHEFTPENTYVYRDKRNRSHGRSCKTCIAVAAKKWRDKQPKKVRAKKYNVKPKAVQ